MLILITGAMVGQTFHPTFNCLRPTTTGRPHIITIRPEIAFAHLVVSSHTMYPMQEHVRGMHAYCGIPCEHGVHGPRVRWRADGADAGSNLTLRSV